MLILGVDPGLRSTGFAVIEGSTRGIRLIEHGVIETPDGAPLARRLREIHAGLTRVLIRTRPAQMAVEDLFAAQRFPRTAILMGHVRGVVCLVAAEEGVEVAPLPPAAVKQAVSGYGGATKGQVQRSVQRLLRVRGTLSPHAADAMAMALTGLSRAGIPLHVQAGETAPRAASGDGS
jgi:crossover junction endodeoxyribonuclease RuvC